MYSYPGPGLSDDYVPNKARKLLIERAEAAWDKAIDESHQHGRNKPKIGAYEAMCKARAAYDHVLGNPGAEEKIAAFETDVIKKVIIAATGRRVIRRKVVAAK